MKVTYIDIYKILTYILISTLALVINHVTIGIAFALTIVLTVMYLTQKKKNSLKNTKLILVFIVLEFMLFFVQLIRTKNNISNYDIFTYYSAVILLLLVFPLYEVISFNKEKFFSSVNRIGIVILFFKSVIWFSYNFLNQDFLFMLLGGKEDWYRSVAGISLARMSGIFLDGLLFSFAISKILQSKMAIQKIKYLFEIIFLYFYAAIIYQSRSQMIFYAFTIFIVILYKIYHADHRLLSIIIFLSSITLLLAINITHLHNFIDSFSLLNDNAGSTYTRIVEYQYYPALWKQSSIFWGFGFQNDGMMVNTINGLIKVYMSDIGILMTLYQFGIVGFIISIIPFIKGFIESIKLFFANHISKDVFYLIFTIYYLVSLLNFNPYFVSLYLLLPIYLAYTMYVSN